MGIMNPSKLRNFLKKLPYAHFDNSTKIAVETIITKYLNGEIVPVVRCKDCIYSRPIDREDSYEAFYGEDCVWCTENDVGMHNHGFCSKGERKDDDTIDCETDG